MPLMVLECALLVLKILQILMEVLVAISQHLSFLSQTYLQKMINTPKKFCSSESQLLLRVRHFCDYEFQKRTQKKQKLRVS